MAGKAFRQNRAAKTVVCEFEAWRKLPTLQLHVIRERRLKEVLPSAHDVPEAILARTEYILEFLCVPEDFATV